MAERQELADLQHPAQHMGLLVEGERVALHPGPRHARQHREQAVMMPWRHRLEVACPHVRRRREGEGLGVAERERRARAGVDREAALPWPAPRGQHGIDRAGRAPGPGVREAVHRAEAG